MANLNNKKKILIVDDEETIVDILRRRFSSMGFSVLTSFDGEDGIRVIKEHEVDLVVCDVEMPKGVSGKDVLQVARKQNPAVRFVAISGYLLSDDSVDQIMGAGADLFLKKPFPSLKEATEQMARLVES